VKKANTLLDKFNRWFASANGVWHTLGFCAVIVAAEYIWPGMDPHGFWLLFWLTVYSAVTQPALAYVGRQSGEYQGTILTHQDALLTQQSVILAHLQAVLEHIEKHEACDCVKPELTAAAVATVEA